MNVKISKKLTQVLQEKKSIKKEDDLSEIQVYGHYNQVYKIINQLIEESNYQSTIKDNDIYEKEILKSIF